MSISVVTLGRDGERIGPRTEPSFHFNMDLEAEVCTYNGFCGAALHRSTGSELEAHADSLRIRRTQGVENNPCAHLGLDSHAVLTMLRMILPPYRNLQAFDEASRGVERQEVLEALNGAGFIEYFLDTSQRIVGGAVESTVSTIRFESNGEIDATVVLTPRGQEAISEYRGAVMEQVDAEEELIDLRDHARIRIQTANEATSFALQMEAAGMLHLIPKLIALGNVASTYDAQQVADGAGITYGEAAGVLSEASSHGWEAVRRMEQDGRQLFVIYPHRLDFALHLHGKGNEPSGGENHSPTDDMQLGVGKHMTDDYCRRAAAPEHLV